ncbi:MAG TPA: DUF1003 domain-containing protein [Candidatus Magasanikbacteria bacterium]|nr:DUF1003 domain-containing protein [Candidatus Magasanikbacteria bacterium]
MAKKITQENSRINRYADFLTHSFGTVSFLTLNAILFLGWILINSGLIPHVPVFDPYPYGLLTTAVSLEAIFLSVIVLISQNRASEIDELREELDLHINIKAENEITKILNMLDAIQGHLGISSEEDAELKTMKHRTNINRIRNELMRIRKKN